MGSFHLFEAGNCFSNGQLQMNENWRVITLMSTTGDILCFYKHLYKQLVKIKYAFNFDAQIYVVTYISQITQIFSHLKLWIAVAKHNFVWLKITILSSVL